MTVAGAECAFAALTVSDEHTMGICVLPDGVPFLTEKHSTLFVRDFYGALHDTVMALKEEGCVNTILLGNAGIGKSWSSMYTLTRLAKEKKTVIYEHVKLGKAWVFDFSDGGSPPREIDVNRSRTAISNLPEASDPQAFYLVDAGEKTDALDAALIDAFTIVYASPFEDHFKGTHKRHDHGPKLFLPCLAYEEAYQIFVATNVKTEDELHTVWDVFGGNTRHLGARKLGAEMAEVDNAIAKLAERGRLATAVGELEANTAASDISHYVLHLGAARQDTDAHTAFTQTGVHFASKVVQAKVASAISLDEIKELQRSSRLATPMTRFEMLTHKVLMSGCKVTARRLCDGTEETLTLPPVKATFVRGFGAPHLLPKKWDYLYSTNANEAGVESFAAVHGAAAGIQSTIYKKPEVNAVLREAMAWVGVEKMRLYFVVPASVADQYKKPVPFKTTFTKKQQEDPAKLATLKQKAANDEAALDAAVDQWVIAIDL
jgi:hypothetical protein